MLYTKLESFPDIDRLQQEGVAHAVSGDVSRAAELYDAAMQAADALPQSQSRELQRARITRDQGFLAVHALVADPELDVEPHLATADSALVVARTMAEQALEPVSGFALDNRSTATVNAEIGATIGLQARAALYGVVRSGERPTKNERNELREIFAEAESFLFNGNNPYYGASNAVRAAMTERLMGSPVGVIDWGMKALLYPAMPDGSHLQDRIAGVRTNVLHLPQLASKQLVQMSVLKRP